MSGSLILVAGRSGAGKTTLIQAAVQRLPQLELLRLTTTRPRRPGEVDGLEHVFVDAATYEARRAAAGSWDHMEHHGHFYGADTDAIKAQLRQGIHIISTVPPDLRAVRLLEATYRVSAITIWLEVSSEVAASRIVGDQLRLARSETDAAKSDFQQMFQPQGVLADDQRAFAAFIQALLPQP